MDNRKDGFIVIAATMCFGVFSKVTVRVPYMAWGYFDQFFLLSLLWWFLYTGALYVAIREYTQNIDSYFRVFGQAAIFGAAATLLKTGIDAITEMFVRQSGNTMISIFVMELVLLLFGCAVMVFLFYFVAKQSISSWKPSLNLYAGIMGGTLALYVGIVFYYLFKLDWALEKYSGAVAKVGEEQARLNLSTKFARESAGIGMVVYVIIFITIWLALRKNSEKRRPS